jgi:hypothetical protein
MLWWFVAALLGVLAFPSAPGTRLDGLPLNSWVEVAALVGLTPLLSAAIRRLARRSLRRLRPAAARAAIAVAVVAVLLKLALVPARPAAFVACFQSTLMAPPAGPCERSFENPFFRSEATRFDRVIDFAPASWDQSFFNALRFNFYPWEPGNRRRDRLPFTATWRGPVRTDGTDIIVTYRGEGVIAVGGATAALPPEYAGLRTVSLAAPPGEHLLRVQFTYDDGSTTDDRTLPGPYAELTVKTEDGGSDAASLLRPAPLPGATRAAAAGLELTVFALVGLLLVWYAAILRRERQATAFAFAAVIVAAAAPALGVPLRLASTLGAWGLLALAAARRSSARLLLVYFAFVVLGAWVMNASHPRFNETQLRGAGEDWLTYESQARTILETWSFEGGEAVYYIQPFFRYVRFAERLLLGDGDPLINLLAWSALHWSLIWAGVVLSGAGALGFVRGLLWVGGAGAVLWLAGTETVFQMIRFSLSEHATWVFLPVGVGLLAGRRSARWPAGAAVLAAALITRPNQAPALGVIAASLLLPAAIRNRGRALVAAGVFTAVCLLPLAHNVHYGGRFVPFTTTADHPTVQGVPFAIIAATPVDASARAQLIDQLTGLAFLEPWVGRAGGGDTLWPPLHLLLAIWVAALALAIWWRVPAHVLLFATAPALYLAVHVVFDITFYYPRHILAAYFAMGLAAMAVSAGGARHRVWPRSLSAWSSTWRRTARTPADAGGELPARTRTPV